MKRASLAVLASAVALTWLPAQPALATPIQGQTPWSVLLCKFADHFEEPKNPQHFEDLFTTEGLGKGGLADFVAEQSRGRASMAGSVVKGWFPMSVTAEQWKAQSPEARVKSCTNAAGIGGYGVPAGHRLAVMVNASVGLDAKVPLDETTAPVVLDPPLWDLATVTAHVLNRSGLSYPRSTLWRSPSWPVWTAPGQYDDQWDALSNPNVHAAPSARFGRGTVGLSGPHLDELGWLPGDRVVTLAKDGVTTRTVKLAPLERPDLPGTLLVRVPHDSDPSQYYTVEFRKKTGQSAGIPGDTVLIHNYIGGRPYLTKKMSDKEPMQAIDAYGVTVTVDSVGSDSATVTVSTDATTKCLEGYDHREAVAGDKVCVTPAAREQARVDNEDAPRWVDYETGGCLSTRRWRLITPTDKVCITPETEQQIIADNQAAPSRTNPVRNVWGPNACADDYVWRQADASDYVCVTMETRLQVLEDNAAAASRWTDGPYGPRTCVSGYVWREAFIGDQVCVTGDRRERARQDNGLAHTRVRWPNGGSSR
ncbi:hypothetical protein ACFQVD_25320 [Streptosporangium amethystogenes subsp. fukuiense]|uniref:Uncharacterized protein n=1 Tax=Streptosporangium amethystogenes subsp. fukuiense TaxID=698418 RepID=A0ABW2T5V9_9ACTN